MTYHYGIRMLHTEDSPEAVKRLFLNYESTVKHFGGVKLSDYKGVASGTVTAASPKDACEKLYAAYNADERPHGYRGRSMSVSDVVILRDDAREESLWFCDSFGFQKLGNEED